MQKSRLPLIGLLTLVAVCIVPSARGAQTLSALLAEHNIPASRIAARDADRQITSFAVLDDADLFMVAYYVDDGSGKLQPPLHVGRYTKRDSRWIEGAISREQAMLPESQIDCLGSAEDIHRLSDVYLIDTHLTPSAGCIIVVSSKLKFENVLDGWYLGGLAPRIVVFQQSQVHFAPTHPLVVRMYDLDLEKIKPGVQSRVPDATLFPLAQDDIRRQYVERLQHLVGDSTWCNVHNSHCDPEQFEGELVSTSGPSGKLLVTSDANRAIAFAVAYSPVGIVPEETIARTPDLKKRVVYVVRLASGGFNYSAFPLEEMKSFGASGIEDLVNPPVLDKVFASTEQ